MALLDMVGELAGTLPGLSPILCETYIRRAWHDIQQERRWSFLNVDGFVVCPVQITAGTVSITQYTDTVTLDATASAAFPLDSATPSPTQMQIRFSPSAPLTAGQIYRIMAVDRTAPTALVLTLDRQVVEATSATSTYQCYRCYITPPQSNFKAWQTIVDMSFGMTLRLNWNSTTFDVVDPQRTAQGDAYDCGFFRAAGPYGTPFSTADPNQEPGAPMYELWPHPVSGRTFYVRYIMHGWELVNPTDGLPPLIDEALVLQRAYGWHA